MHNLSDDHVKSASSIYRPSSLLLQYLENGIWNMYMQYMENIIYPRGYSIAKRTLISFRTVSFVNSPVESLMFSTLSLMEKFNIDY